MFARTLFSRLPVPKLSRQLECSLVRLRYRRCSTTPPSGSQQTPNIAFGNEAPKKANSGTSVFHIALFGLACGFALDALSPYLECFQSYLASTMDELSFRGQKIPGLSMKEFKFQGKTVRVEMVGRGGPVIVINGGTGSQAGELMKLLGGIATVICYTHAGLDFDPKALDMEKKAPSKSTVDKVPSSDYESLELAAVLNEMNIDHDVILVSYHNNWLSTLKAAFKNADFVKGIVLVDPLLPQPNEIHEMKVEYHQKSPHPWFVSPKKSLRDSTLLYAHEWWMEYVYRDAIFHTPRTKRPFFHQLFKEAESSFSPPSVLRHVFKDPRPEYLYLQEACLAVENHVFETNFKRGSVVRPNQAVQEEVISKCLEYSRQAQLNYEKLPKYSHPTNHQMLLRWVRDNFARSDAGKAAQIPIFVTISRLRDEEVKGPEVIRKGPIEFQTSPKPHTVALRSALYQHSMWLGKEWASALPGAVHFVQSRRRPDEPLDADPRAVAAFVRDLTLQARTQPPV